VTLAAAAKQNIDLLADLEVAGSSVVGITILRTLLLIRTENWDTAGNVLLAGTIVDDKGYVGTTLDLASNRNLDWYWYARVFPTWTGAIAATSQPFPNSGLPLDIRSRRVIKDMGRTAILALTNGSGTSKTVDVFTRTLIGLP